MPFWHDQGAVMKQVVHKLLRKRDNATAMLQLIHTLPIEPEHAHLAIVCERNVVYHEGSAHCITWSCGSDHRRQRIYSFTRTSVGAQRSDIVRRKTQVFLNQARQRAKETTTN